MLKLNRLLVLAILLCLPRFAGAVIIDERLFSGTDCGGDCFGLTYHLVVTDAADSNSSSFTASLTITGTYTGSMTYIGAVDIKPGSITSPPAPTLTTAPGGTWTTRWEDGQSANNCDVTSSGKFLCSFDSGQNTLAPVTTGTFVNYTWAWNFSLDSGGYTFGHLGVNFTNSNDGCKDPLNFDCRDGQNISLSSGGRVPEPEAFILCGLGLLILGFLGKKNRGRA